MDSLSEERTAEKVEEISVECRSAGVEDTQVDISEEKIRAKKNSNGKKSNDENEDEEKNNNDEEKNNDDEDKVDEEMKDLKLSDEEIKAMKLGDEKDSGVLNFPVEEVETCVENKDEEDHKEMLEADITQKSDQDQEVDTAISYNDREEEHIDMNALMASEIKSKEKLLSHCQAQGVESAQLFYDDLGVDTAVDYSDGEEEEPRLYKVGDTRYKQYRAVRRASFYVDKEMENLHAYYTDHGNRAVAALIASGMMAND